MRLVTVVWSGAVLTVAACLAMILGALFRSFPVQVAGLVVAVVAAALVIVGTILDVRRIGRRVTDRRRLAGDSDSRRLP